MRSLFYTLLLSSIFYTNTAQADVLPEPEDSEPANEDTSSESDEDADEKTGCSSVGNIDVGMALLPFFGIGFVAYTRRRKEE